MAMRGSNVPLLLRYRKALKDISEANPVFVSAAKLQEVAREALKPDNCEMCQGAKGGVKGNENLVDGKVLCDYCTVELG